MTLAQQYLEQGRPYRSADPNVTQLIKWTHDFIIARLLAPSSSHPGDADKTAERFVFDESPVDVMASLADQIDRKTMLQTTHIPHLNMWIEIPTEIYHHDGNVKGRIGFMIGRVPWGETTQLINVCAVVVISDMHEATTPICLMELPEFPVKFDIGPKGAEIKYRPFYFAETPFHKMEEQMFREVDRILSDLFDSLFIITLPRAIEERPGGFGPRKEKVQRRTGKPHIEFRRVHIRIGKASVRYTGAAGSAGAAEGTGKRKMHRVGFFLRTYRKDRDEPKVVVMEPFWRGDPKLGVIIKEKHYHGEAIAAAKARSVDLSKLRDD